MIKSKKIGIAIVTSVCLVCELTFLIASGSIDRAHQYVAANIVARTLQLEFSDVANIPKTGMLATITDPDLVRSMGKEFVAQVAFCPVGSNNMPTFIARQSSLKCAVTTHNNRQGEIEISIGSDKIYSLPIMIAIKK